jgi:uncharacterized protein YuzE
MKIKYDGESDTLDILVKDEQIYSAEEYEQMIINFDKNGKIVEIEILDASRFFGGFLTGMIQAKPKGRMVEITV